MTNTLTREELDLWLQDLSVRMKVEAETALTGDLAEIVAGEVEWIEPRVAAANFDYLHDKAQGLIEALERRAAGESHDSAR